MVLGSQPSASSLFPSGSSKTCLEGLLCGLTAHRAVPAVLRRLNAHLQKLKRGLGSGHGLLHVPLPLGKQTYPQQGRRASWVLFCH